MVEEWGMRRKDQYDKQFKMMIKLYPGGRIFMFLVKQPPRVKSNKKDVTTPNKRMSMDRCIRGLG